ncbi:N-acetyl-D-glucosamine kinase-like [Oppia nitens]|uniref:N-acetyl-D-glucosamine kinase-like n=1 Tax=Oppia nitens TaxID=1686743 RepID=UPI0023DCDF59|nr:N-acetyl-D-glucosamine kinase-like [Oppia nitens]
MSFFVGIEGGASFSKAVLLDSDGQVLAKEDSGPSTNHWMIGQKECFLRIHSLIQSLLRSASLSTETRIKAVGLCLSGCEDQNQNQKLCSDFSNQFPELFDHCLVASDTMGSLFTCFPDGGVVLIAGTGSNCLLFNADGSSAKCGGWGHLLGDYGAGISIANSAVRSVLESEDNFRQTIDSPDSSRVRQLVVQHFGLPDDNLAAILRPAYAEFDKSFFASISKSLAKLAADGDQLAASLFFKAGQDLAEHLNAILPKAQASLLKNGLSVVCVGSVFKSWSLLEPGFLSALTPELHELTLRLLTTSSAFGAAFLASRKSGHTLRMDFDRNSELLRHIRR